MTIPLVCPRCLAVIGHGHLDEHGDDIGGWVERLPHDCPRELGETA